MQIALRAGFGQDEVSHGSERYRVGVDGLVIVPPSIAVYLIKNGGFQVVSRPEAEPARPQPGDVEAQFLVRISHPTAAGCSYGGCEYRRNQNGEFLVPATAVAELTGHGFVAVAPPDRPRESSRPILVSPILVLPAGEQSQALRRSPPVNNDARQGPNL